MKSLAFIIAITSSIFSFSQSANYIIDVNYSGSMYEGQQATYHAFNFSPGIEFKSGFEMNFGIGLPQIKWCSVIIYRV